MIEVIPMSLVDSWTVIEADAVLDDPRGKEWHVIALFRFAVEADAYIARHNGDGGIRLRARPATIEEIPGAHAQ